MEEKSPKIKILHEINPFKDEVLNTLKETTRVKREFVSGDKRVANIITNASNGEKVGETALIRYKKVDTQQFTKIYSDKAKTFLGMTGAATSVFEYVMLNLEKDQDQIYLFIDDIVKYASISDKSCKRGIQWLVDNDVLAKSIRPHWFFINPTMFFNGDRLTLIEVYEKDKGPDPKYTLPENQNFLTK